MNLLSILLASALAASAQAPAANLTRIGAAAAVKGMVKAQAPGAAVGRVMESGKPLFLNDHVTTGAAGRLQVMLLDETVFTMGPNSDMVLDEFVYDPSNDAGKVTARVTKGVFRFVTGKVARKDPANMKVNLPVGTIGIRGTIAAGEASEAGSSIILLGPGSQNNANENPGSVAVGNAGSQVVITQPGFGTTIAPGQPPASVTDMSQKAQQLIGLLGEPPPASQTGAPSGNGKSRISREAGEEKAQGGVLALESGALGEIVNNMDNNQVIASQTNGIVDGLSTWDQVRGVEAGIVIYDGQGTYTCSGPNCAGGIGTSSLFLDVDFGARQFQGSIVLQPASPGGLVGIQSTSILNTSFSSLSGNASVLLHSGGGGPGNINNADFDNSVLSFHNRGGIAAKDAKVDILFDDHAMVGAPTTAAGSATATRP
ncbi:MAG TPA: hypothetical protein DEB40_05555 [Elusimicrobia bacterium]|nr:hypothetical protein [Elusimicrobiota bacterium]HBT61191.1 hypothetical protein [Elusimicrobiota bacterium]